jgi:hypothetical protein
MPIYLSKSSESSEREVELTLLGSKFDSMITVVNELVSIEVRVDTLTPRQIETAHNERILRPTP